MALDADRLPAVRIATDLAPAAQRLMEESQLAAEIASGVRSMAAAFIWRSAPALIVSAKDTQMPDYPAAASRFAANGWPVATRRSGGGAFPVGPGTLQLALVSRYAAPLNFDAIYTQLAEAIIAALGDCGIVAEAGEVPGAFCGGRYDIAVCGRKIAGLSQRWQPCPAGYCVIASAAVLVSGEPRDLTGIVNAFHAAAGSPVRCRAAAISTLTEVGFDAARERDIVNSLAGKVRDMLAQTQARCAQPEPIV
jgi:hypothetical protein